MSPSRSTPTLMHMGFTTRMFIACMCLHDADLERLGFMLDGQGCCVSEPTRARSILHRLVAEDADLAGEVGDLLDVRHASVVLDVRSRSAEDLGGVARGTARAGLGEDLAGLAWALLTDPRDDVVQLGRNLMGECYVRGIQGLALGAPYRTGDPATMRRSRGDDA